MAFFKETTRSIKILLIGLNSFILLFTALFVFRFLQMRGSASGFDQLQYAALGGDTMLFLMLASIPFLLFLIYLGFRFSHYIRSNPKLVIGVFIVNFLIFIGLQLMNFDEIGIMTYVGLALQIYILINIFRLAKEYSGFPQAQM